MPWVSNWRSLLVSACRLMPGRASRSSVKRCGPCSSSRTIKADAYRDAAGVFVLLPVTAEEDRQISRMSQAVIAPEPYLENLLMPYVIDSVRERGVLPHAIRADFPVSWSSHLDIADAAVALFERTDVTGVVSVGQYPAITGPDLAEAFGTRLGRDVVFEPRPWPRSGHGAGAADSRDTRSRAMSTIMSSWPPTSPRRPTSSRSVRASTPWPAAAISAWRRKEE